MQSSIKPCKNRTDVISPSRVVDELDALIDPNGVYGVIPKTAAWEGSTSAIGLQRQQANYNKLREIEHTYNKRRTSRYRDGDGHRYCCGYHDSGRHSGDLVGANLILSRISGESRNYIAEFRGPNYEEAIPSWKN